MTDTTNRPDTPGGTAPDGASSVHTSPTAQRRLRRRYAAERRFQIYGIGAIGVGIAMLVVLLGSIVVQAYGGLFQTRISLDVPLTPELSLATSDQERVYESMISDELTQYVPEAASSIRLSRQLIGLIGGDPGEDLARRLVADPSLLGSRADLDLALSSEARPVATGEVALEDSELSDFEREAFGQLVQAGIIRQGADPSVRLTLMLDSNEILSAGDFEGLAAAAVARALPSGVPAEDADRIVSPLAADVFLRQIVRQDPTLIGRTVAIELPVTDPLDQLYKGYLDRDLPVDQLPVESEAQLAAFDALVETGDIYSAFNWQFFTGGPSNVPQMAGILGAVVGSFLTLFVCLIISFPIAVSAAIYLEEFAPKNRWTDLIEVNINNLAAVPSIVFGLLGLAVFLNFFGLPRSAPLVGGMVLALMTLPTIIIATRASLKAIPPSIREAALGMGASRLQTVTHHVLPLALPGILTGTIIGLAQALGETAPLLMIGMVAFVQRVPGGFTDPAAVLPVQVYLWAEESERGFTQLTSLAICVLLAFLILMNAFAVWLRKRFERRW